jgi:ferritin-like metal-binding protein YciE
MTLHQLFVKELKDLASAENQLVKALPKMAKAAASPELKKAFQNHLEETKHQVERIAQAFDSVGETPKTALCKGMAGLVEEGKSHIEGVWFPCWTNSHVSVTTGCGHIAY